jgi:hypothetical protein
MTTVNEVDMKIDGHIDKCELRYQAIQVEMRACNARLKRIEETGLMVAGGAFTTGVAIIMLLIQIIAKGA